MSLKVKCLEIDTEQENIAFLPADCRPYRPGEFKGFSKIEIKGANGKSILASLNIVHNPKILEDDELGLSLPAFRRLGAECGARVRIYPAAPPLSLDHVRAKISGGELGEKAFRAIIRDIAGFRYSKMEIAAFLVGCASFMTVEEILFLTRAMAAAGTRLDWTEKPVVDKHCVGGVPGNRTSMIVVPIVAAHGLLIPKTSSRAITSPAGTADTMEVLAKVDLSVAAMKKVVEKTSGCLVWGGRVNLSPADDILISVERPLGIDTPEQMVASIMSKKIAAGSTHLLVDIPVGPDAKVRTRREATRLRKLFEHVAGKISLAVDFTITDGSQPVGFGIGPALEARDVMAVLEGRAEAPRDLRERGLLLAGKILDFDPELPGGKGFETAKRLLDSGQAFDKMTQIIAAQGPSTKVSLGKLKHRVKAEKSGTVAAMDGGQLARIARAAGAPLFKGAGVDLRKKTGDAVKAGETLYVVYSDIKADHELAGKRIEHSTGIRVA